MRLWFDEDLSPTLVRVANQLGFEATCNRDRGLLGATDPTLRAVVQAEGFVFVTDNAADFAPMYARDDVHPGLIAMPGAYGRDRQQEIVAGVLAWVDRAAQAAGETSAAFMVNSLVEADRDGECTVRDLPAA